MENNWLVKCVVFGIMDGLTQRGRPCMKWLGDIKKWRQLDLTLSTGWRGIKHSGDGSSDGHSKPTGGWDGSLLFFFIINTIGMLQSLQHTLSTFDLIRKS
jgi:hypothetical protein